MKYLVIFHRTPTSFGAHVEDIPGCIAVGETLEQTRRLIQEAMYLHMELMREHGETIPESEAFAEMLEPIPYDPAADDVVLDEAEELELRQEVSLA